MNKHLAQDFPSNLCSATFIELHCSNLIHTTVAPAEPQSTCKQRLDPLGASDSLLGCYIRANILAIYERFSSLEPRRKVELGGQWP